MVFLRGLQREPGETKICTKRIRNRSSIRKLVKTIIHHLKCKYSRNKNNRKPSSIFFLLLFLCTKNPTIQISNPKILHKGGGVNYFMHWGIWLLCFYFLKDSSCFTIEYVWQKTKKWQHLFLKTFRRGTYSQLLSSTNISFYIHCKTLAHVLKRICPACPGGNWHVLP